jgi:hypothetical protein
MLESESLVSFILLELLQFENKLSNLFRNLDPNAGFWNAGPSLSPNLTPQSFQNQPNFNPGYQVYKNYFS